MEAIRNAFPPLLPPESINVIFGKIEDIFLINKELYDTLTAASDDKIAKKIGAIFMTTVCTNAQKKERKKENPPAKPASFKLNKQ